MLFGFRASSSRLEVGAPNRLCVPADARWDGRTRRKLSGGSPWLLLFGGQSNSSGLEIVAPDGFSRSHWRQAARILVEITSPRRLSGCLCHGLPAVAGGIAVGWRMPGYCHACHAPVPHSFFVTAE